MISSQLAAMKDQIWTRDVIKCGILQASMKAEITCHNN